MAETYSIYDTKTKQYLDLGKKVFSKKGFQIDSNHIARFLFERDPGGGLILLPDTNMFAADMEINQDFEEVKFLDNED